MSSYDDKSSLLHFHSHTHILEAGKIHFEAERSDNMTNASFTRILVYFLMKLANYKILNKCQF
jgi:hypothetical protein